jgi:hypothetical protein
VNPAAGGAGGRRGAALSGSDELPYGSLQWALGSLVRLLAPRVLHHTEQVREGSLVRGCAAGRLGAAGVFTVHAVGCRQGVGLRPVPQASSVRSATAPAVARARAPSSGPALLDLPDGVPPRVAALAPQRKVLLSTLVGLMNSSATRLVEPAIFLEMLKASLERHRSITDWALPRDRRKHLWRQ